MFRFIPLLFCLVGSIQAQIPARFSDKLDLAAKIELSGESDLALAMTDTLIKDYQALAQTKADSFLALVYHKRGVFYYYSDHPIDSSYSAYLKALNIREEIFPKDHIQISNTAHNLAVAYRSQYQYRQASQYLRKAIEIRRKVGKAESLALNLLEFANINEALQDFESAESYCLSAISEFEKIQDTLNLARSFLLLGSIHSSLQAYEKAVNNYRKAFRYYRLARDETGIAKTHHNMGESFHGLSQTDSAAFHYQAARRYYESNASIEDSVNLAKLLNNLGVLEKLKKDDSAARTYLLASFTIRKHLYYPPDPEFAESYANLGDLAMNAQQYDSALLYYHKGLGQLLPEWQEANPFDFPQITDTSLILGARSAVDTLLLAKAKCLIHMATHRSDSLDLLATAVQLYLQADQLLARRLRENSGNAAQLFWLQQAQDRYEQALILCKRLDRPDWAFRFLENGRSRILLASILTDKAQQRAGLPAAVLNQEQQLQSNLLAAKALVNAEGAQDPAINEEFRKKLLALHEFRRELENQYPAYFSFRYQNQVPELSEVQSYLQHQGDMAIFQYYLGKKYWHLLYLKSNSIEHYQLAAWPELIEQLSQLLPFDPENPNYLQHPDDFESFKKVSHQLYRALIPENLELADRWLIMPSGALSRIPFELLIQQSETEKFGSAPSYVVLKHSVSYAYSTTILLQQRLLSNQQSQTNGDCQEILAIAPLRFQNLAELSFSQDELNVLKQYFTNGCFLQKEMATKNQFIARSGAAEILHLSTHAQAPPGSDPWIAFWGDSLMSLSEIYSLQSPAKMVVLSACETHAGLWQAGEGLMSLARGFQYAGIPSTVASLWRVNDAATSRLMQDFYAAIQEGHPKDVALARAKRHLLQTQLPELPPAPYFWAAFMHIGDPAPIHERGFIWLYLFASLGALIVLLLLFYLQRKKASGPRQDSYLD